MTIQPGPVATSIPGVFGVLVVAGELFIDYGDGFQIQNDEDEHNPFRGIHPDALYEFR